MLQIIVIVVAVLGFTMGVEGVRADSPTTKGEPQPLKNVPDGWTYLRRQGVDTWPGAYHDKVSGAFVEFELGTGIFTGLLPPETARKRGAREDAGAVSGVPFRRFRLADVQCSNAGATKATSQPQRLVVDFTPNSKPWNLWSFSACIGNELQEKRVNDLLFGEMRLWLDILTSTRVAGGRYVAEAEISQIKEGTEWSDVRRVLGPPVESERAPAEGFKVRYEVAQPTRGQAWLVFDRNQRLVKGPSS